MKLSNTSKIRNSRHCLNLFVAALGLAGLLSVPVQAHETFNKDATVIKTAVSASAARRMVRNYLSEAGYTRSLKSGGAQIKNIELHNGYYAVQVVLRDNSATSTTKASMFVNANTGLLTYSPSGRSPASTAVASN
jgi:hypothetical protein